MKKIIALTLLLAALPALAARDGAGNYTLPASVNPVIPGQPIKASWANTTLSDLAVEMTWSLDRRGYGGMTAPLACTAGSPAAPALTFTGALSSGLYLQSASPATVAMSTASADRQIWTAAGSTLTVPLLLPAGSLGAPSMSFSAATSTGFYYLSNTIRAAVGATPAQSWSATGTTVPGTLDVTGAVGASGTITLSGAGNQSVNKTGGIMLLSADGGVQISSTTPGKILNMKPNGANGFEVNDSTVIAFKPLSLQTNRIIEMGDPVAAQDAATKLYVDARNPVAAAYYSGTATANASSSSAAFSYLPGADLGTIGAAGQTWEIEAMIAYSKDTTAGAPGLTLGASAVGSGTCTWRWGDGTTTSIAGLGTATAVLAGTLNHMRGGKAWCVVNLSGAINPRLGVACTTGPCNTVTGYAGSYIVAKRLN